ncbi:VOC family protein [Rhodobacteraceae bacterium NNCM2]|nr:VOC family protein [Coraliihabitans acroporae]
MNGGNLPGPGEIFLDHIGHFVPDHAACSQALEQSGFTVTPFSAQHAPDPETGLPSLTGTGNVCVMLRKGYLEFLAHTADTAIGREFMEALKRRAGLHLAAFAVPDAETMLAELSKAGMPMRPLVRMSREIGSPDGPLEARFTVARLQKGVMPEGRIQALTHGTEAAMWQPRWLDHANGAVGLSSVIVSAPDMHEAAARFSAFLCRPVEEEGRGLKVALDRGMVEILPEDAASLLVGRAVDAGKPAIVGYRVEVKDLKQTIACMNAAGLPVRLQDGLAVALFPKALGIGAWVFEAAEAR